MRRLLLSAALLLPWSAAAADTVLAARTIPARSIIGPADVVVHASDVAGTISRPDMVIGMEARVALYAGRPIRMGDIGMPAIIERNDIVTLQYTGHGIAIATEGRALGRAAAGDVLRVMNLNSRATVTARIGEDGIAYVQP
jgi:flagella basal body P-ring formation protein FlgA